MAELQLNLGQRVKNGTNILDYTVPPELDRTVRFAAKGTRLGFLDAAFGGAGATPSQIVLFTGMPGAGKTTLMLQAADSLTSMGHCVLVNTNEESVIQLAKTSKRLGLRNGFVVGNDPLMPRVLRHAAWLAGSLEGRKAADGSPAQLFLVIDSLQAMDDGKYRNGATNGNTPVRVATMVAKFCKEKQSGIYPIAIVIGHVNKAGDYAGKGTIKHLVDSHLHLILDQVPESPTFGKRLCAMLKNRMGSGSVPLVLKMTGRGLMEDKAL